MARTKPRHRQRPIGDFGAGLRVDFRHGLNGYKAHACRCDVCSAAMSAYGKARYVPKEPAGRTIAPPLVSWWVGRVPEGFTAFVEAQEAQRMRESRFGRIVGKPITTDEVSR